MKNDTSLFSLRNIEILTNMQKIFFVILLQTALTVGLFWTILKSIPMSALLSFTILYFWWYQKNSFGILIHDLSWRQNNQKCLTITENFWHIFWRTFWRPVFDAVQNSSLEKWSKSLIKCQYFLVNYWPFLCINWNQILKPNNQNPK